MRVRPNLALFTFASAAMLAGCERRASEGASDNAHTPAPINPVAKGIDGPPPVTPAPGQ